MLSKLLWPTPPSRNPDGSELSVGQEQARKRALMRGKTLRSVLGDLKAPSPLEKRRVRNSFEHFDERLDQFLDESRSRGRIVADQNIGPIANMIITNTGPPRYLRHIDPSTGTVLVLEESQEIGELVTAIRDVGERAKAATEALWQARRAASLREAEGGPEGRP